jgi:hypothetical protein
MTTPEGPDDELALEVEVDLAAEEFARLSPAARRFAAGEMDDDEARRLGYLPDEPT